MKLDDVKNLSEMAKPAQICTNCGEPKTKSHYFYNKEWRCKGGKGKFTTQQDNQSLASDDASDKTTTVQPTKATHMQQTQSNVNAQQPTSSENVQTQIQQWLKDHGVSEFTIDNGVINVEGDVHLRNFHKAQFPTPVQFGIVGGDFVISGAGLQTLRGSPRQVGVLPDGSVSPYSGNFMCGFNDITTLEGGPSFVGGVYSAANCPQLNSIKGIAKVIEGAIQLAKCPNLKSLEGIQDMVEKMDGSINLKDTPIESHVIGLLLVPGLTSVVMDNKNVETILNKHLKEGRNALDCQEELIDAGFHTFAEF